MPKYQIPLGRNADPNKGGGAGWEKRETATVDADDADKARYITLARWLGWTQLSPPVMVA